MLVHVIFHGFLFLDFILLQALQGIRENAATRQDNVLLEYRCFTRFFEDFYLHRYECALLLNKSRKTYVLPVFIGAVANKTVTKNVDGEDKTSLSFTRFDFKSVPSFPAQRHARTKDAAAIIKRLRYNFL
jgi:hypothetical protein